MKEREPTCSALRSGIHLGATCCRNSASPEQCAACKDQLPSAAAASDFPEGTLSVIFGVSHDSARTNHARVPAMAARAFNSAETPVQNAADLLSFEAITRAACVSTRAFTVTC